MRASAGSRLVPPGSDTTSPTWAPEPRCWGARLSSATGMNALRRILYIQAALWAIAGIALAVAPRQIVVSLFDQPPLSELTWIRLVGVEAVTVAMLMVLVAHRLEDLWWWSWAFAFVETGTAALGLLNAGFGLRPGQSGTLWWIIGAVGAAFALGVLWGLLQT